VTGFSTIYNLGLMTKSEVPAAVGWVTLVECAFKNG